MNLKQIAITAAVALGVLLGYNYYQARRGMG